MPDTFACLVLGLLVGFAIGHTWAVVMRKANDARDMCLRVKNKRREQMGLPTKGKANG